MTMRAMDMAMGMAHAGFRVMPVAREKRPLTAWKNGGRGSAATWDEDVVAEWARRWPDAAYGIAAGEMRDGKRLLVVDCDAHGADPDAFLMAVIRWMTEVVGMTTAEASTLLVRTRSGGAHLYWDAAGVPDETISAWGNAVGIATRDEGLIDIDLRTPGRGYVVGPEMMAPGFHAGHYSLQVDRDMLVRDGMRIRDLILPMPPALVDWLTERRSASRATAAGTGTWEDGAAYAPPTEPIAEGRRNDELWRFCRSRRHRLTPEQLRVAAHFVNHEFCRPPMDAGEVERIVAHALTAA